MTQLQAVLDLARVPLNDAKDIGGSDASCRYKDAELLSYLLNLLLQAFRNRGDLFVGNYANPPLLTWGVTQPLPIPDEYVQVFADGVTARAESKDDEFISNPRAAAFLGLFNSVVTQ